MLVLAVIAAGALCVKAAPARLSAEGALPVLPHKIAHPRVNPNTASEASLLRLPGLGPTRVAEILRYRQAAGGAPFQRASDLDKVHGIGSGTVAKISEYLDLPQ